MRQNGHKSFDRKISGHFRAPQKPILESREVYSQFLMIGGRETEFSVSLPPKPTPLAINDL